MEIVNGYPCFNCTDVDNAKKGIDPAHPQDGPNGANANAHDKTVHGPNADPAVTFGGALSALNESQTSGSDSNSLAGEQSDQQGYSFGGYDASGTTSSGASAPGGSGSLVNVSV